MKIVISEDQKKKLFVPRDIDTREERFNDEIKKFLVSIKGSIVWEYLGSIETSFNYESGYDDASYFDLNDRYSTLVDIKNVIIDEYGKEEGDIKYYDFHSKVDKIREYMEGLLQISSEDEGVVYVWNIIKHLGDGHFEFNQHREVKIAEKIKEIKI